jgi:hypothetical protein
MGDVGVSTRRFAPGTGGACGRWNQSEQSVRAMSITRTLNTFHNQGKKKPAAIAAALDNVVMLAERRKIQIPNEAELKATISAQADLIWEKK